MISAAGNALALEEYTHKADSDQYADDREMERANLKNLATGHVRHPHE